nr:CRISPR-associated helicase Cas3' [Streptomonospora nanhaiensis]
MAVWGKTGEGSRNPRISPEEWHPLVAHMVDTMEVAKQVWEHYLSAAFRDRFAEGLGVSGVDAHKTARSLFLWLAALHDLGKCAPGFQNQSQLHVRRATEALPFPGAPENHPHNLVSAHLLYAFTAEAGWAHEASAWVANVVGGHHGVFPQPGSAETPLRTTQIGGAEWRTVQRELFQMITRLADVPLGLLADHVPSIGSQLTCAGAVILCDWLASNEDLFHYSGPWTEDYPKLAAARARDFQRLMQLEDVWRPARPASAPRLYADRFGIREPRDTQTAAYEVAAEMDRPGLAIIEAPTGEGKTEAALAMAEVLAARFGFNGLFFGLPTQATGNQIFDRVLDKWLQRLPQDPLPTVGLVHGKASRHKRYHDLPLGGIGEHGEATPTASQWMRGSKKALLCPITVGTVDQLLFAGVSAPHVMLRHLALANKVVVIDEVHAYDAYMSHILHRVLHWLGQHRVPVILLSATLPPAQREALIAAYTGSPADVPAEGYPQITHVPAPLPEERAAASSFFAPSSAESPRPTARVRVAKRTEDRAADLAVELRPESGAGDLARLSGEIAERTAGGGCVLVLRNTVVRTQQTYEALRKFFPANELTLAHARFTAADRAALDERLRTGFGPPVPDAVTGEVAENQHRPARHVVVASQVAEQSLDVDFDLVVTDLAPVDLLVQRAGRLHRHRRPRRPAGLSSPVLVVTGYTGRSDGGPPSFPTSDGKPYPHHFLLRTLAVLRECDRVHIPDDVPGLIDQVYGGTPLGPKSWHSSMERAAENLRESLAALRRQASALLLAEPDPTASDLSELQHSASHGVDEESAGNRLSVRLGEPSAEIILLRKVDETTVCTVSAGEQTRIPLDRAPSAKRMKDAVLDQAIRLPLRMVPIEKLFLPAAWKHALWCQRLRVLVLSGRDGSVRESGKSFVYSSEAGWTHQNRDT